jgi:hypothetical protein
VLLLLLHVLLCSEHGKKLVISEYGMGGGCGGDYATVCPNAAAAVKQPYFGTMPTMRKCY